MYYNIMYHVYTSTIRNMSCIYMYYISILSCIYRYFLADSILAHHVTSLDVSIDFKLLLKNYCKILYIVYILHGTGLLEKALWKGTQ